METVAALSNTLLLRSTAVFHPRQSAVAGKNLRSMDAVMDSEQQIKQVPSAVRLGDLIDAASQRTTDVVTLANIATQTSVARKLVDFYVMTREFGVEWDRFAALYPEAAADGWIGLLVNRARVLVAEVDEISNESRSNRV